MKILNTLKWVCISVVIGLLTTSASISALTYAVSQYQEMLYHRELGEATKQCADKIPDNNVSIYGADGPAESYSKFVQGKEPYNGLSYGRYPAFDRCLAQKAYK